jgi:dimeric dUTPase (all-alpha-NTP-PPase superfamily)
MNSEDRLDKMFSQQKDFMDLLSEQRSFPDFPLDLTKKESQAFIKGIAYEAAGELYEAIVELKNSKLHRATEIENSIDREKYVEELIDCQHYLIEIALLSGITIDEFYHAYLKKGETNSKRIKEGY